MTTGQKKRAVSLIKRECCNHNDGSCLLLDGGERACAQRVSYTVCCKWFRWCVLPQDEALETELFRKSDAKCCEVCGLTFQATSNRAKYCDRCAREVHRKQKAASERKRRSSVDK